MQKVKKRILPELLLKHPLCINPILELTTFTFLLLITFCLTSLQLNAAEVQLNSGFNLFSYPVTPPINYKCSELKTELGAEQVSRLDTQTQQFKSCLDSQPDFSILAGEGYVVNSLTHVQIGINGEAVCPEINLAEGINIIGIPTPPSGMGCYDLLQAIGDKQSVASIQQFNTQTGSYDSCVYDRIDPTNTPLGSNFSIASGQAYMVSMLQAQTAIQLNDLQDCLLPTPTPVISGFQADSGPVGSLVTINGDNFSPTNTLSPQVTLNKKGGGSIIAPLASYDNQQLKVTIPTGADTGPFTVTVGQQNTSSSDSYTVLASSSFALSAAPVTTQIIQGFSASYSIELASSNSFAPLVTLSINGLPAGITAQFEPTQLAAGQQSLLTLTAAINQALGTVQFNINAAAEVEGINLSETVALAVETVPVSTTFAGRAVVGDSQLTPLAGITVEFLGRDGDGNPTGCVGQTVSDAAGNFMLSNLPPECIGGQLIRYEGDAVSNLPGVYADVDLFYEISSGQVTESPVLINLPRIDDKETIMVLQNAAVDQTFTFTTVPDMKVTFYAGTTLTLKDGTQPDPFPFIVMNIPVDRLPDTMPPDPTSIDPFFVAFQPANTEASQPVAVSFPNVINTPPGTKVPLMTLDPTKGVMLDYGTGTISANGVSIIPDFDPNYPGHRYGLVHFDWHGPRPPPPPPPTTTPPKKPPEPKPECTSKCCKKTSPGGPPAVADPILLSSCLLSLAETDISLSGGRGSIAIQRNYRELSSIPGPFGLGSQHNFAYGLDTNAPQNRELINLIMPDGNRVPFVRGSDDKLRNNTAPTMRGAEMTVIGNNAELAWKNKTIYRFIPRANVTDSVLDSITDANGNKTSLIRNSANLIQIIEVIDAVGRKLTLDYDSSSRITEITDPIGRAVQYSYNNLGKLASITDPEGGVTRYDYDSQRHLTKITDARNIVKAENTYDANNRVIQQIQANGGVFTFDYKLFNPVVANSNIQQTTVTDPLGYQTRYRFNSQQYTLDATDALGQLRVFGRQLGTNQLTSISGSGECDICGNTAAGAVQFNYDDNGNILTRTDVLGNATAFTYDPVFNTVTSTTDALNNQTQSQYDARGNLVSLIDAKGNKTQLSYDDFGLLKSITDPLGQQTVLDYDDWANLISTTDALGNQTTFIYDAISRLIVTTDSLGHTSRLEYDKLNRVVASTDPQGNITRFSYDEVGNLLSVTDAKNQNTSFAYDVMDQLVLRTDALGHAESYAYDLNGNLTSYTDRRGQITQFEYDVLNRPIKTIYHDGSTVLNRYDAFGRLLERNNSISDTVIINYDDAGRLRRTSNTVGTIDYNLDKLGRVISRQIAGQTPVNYTYDANGNLLESAANQGSVSFTYDVANRRTALTRDNGVSTTYGYDILNRLTTLAHKQGAVVLDTQNYQYNKIGNRTDQHTELAASYQTQTSSRVYGLGNRLLEIDDLSYTYDNNGNRLSETGPAGTTSYLWDARNRLNQVTASDGVTTTFIYDALGNLMAREVNNSSNDIRQDFLVDDISNVIQINDDQGGLASVLTGRSIDSHLATFADTGKTDYLLRNSINSTVASTDENGTMVSQYAYEPFGETTTEGSGDIAFQYTGRVPAADNLYYYRARFYDPKAGRFISEDPIGFGGGDMNLYRYVLNNPVNLVDPFGYKGKAPLPSYTFLENTKIPQNRNFLCTPSDVIPVDYGEIKPLISDDEKKIASILFDPLTNAIPTSKADLISKIPGGYKYTKIILNAVNSVLGVGEVQAPESAP